MKVTIHRSAAAFRCAAGQLLDADPVRHTIAHTVLDRLLHGSDAAVLLTVSRRGAVVGAVLRERGHPAVVSALPAELAGEAEAAAAAVDPEPDAVVGPVARAEAYAAAHAARTGAEVGAAMRMRLFRLVTLTPPERLRGAARPAGPADVDLLAHWQSAFAAEAMPEAPPPGDDGGRGIRDALARGAGYLLWEVDGEPVAYAGARRPVAGMSRIGPVYTPPALRGRGHGSAVTAAATAWSREAGAREVVLFTDLANPTSNAIYPRLGFRPVEDACELRFVRPPGG